MNLLPMKLFAYHINEESKAVSWTDVSSDNIVTEGRRTRQPRKRDPADGYHFTTMSDDMDDFLCAQTTYIQSMQTIAQVGEAIDSAVNYIVLT